MHIMQVTRNVTLVEKENVNMKERYTIPELEIVRIECDDIITTSREEDETPFVPYSMDDDAF